MDAAQDYILEAVRSAQNDGYSVQEIMKWLAEIMIIINES